MTENTTAPEEFAENKEVVIENKVEPIEIGEEGAEEINEDNPLAAIYAKRTEQLKAQVDEIAKPQEAPPETAKKKTAKVNGAEVTIEDGEVVVTINGKEKLVSQSKIDEAGGLATYQIRAAASEKLNQASAELRRVNEQTEQLNAREQAIAVREQAMQETKKPDLSSPDDLRQMASQYHEAIMEGSIDLANELLIKMQATQTAMAINPDEIASKAVQRARTEIANEYRAASDKEFEVERIEAMQDCQERFPEIFADAELLNMANQKTITIQKGNPTWRPGAIINEAAKSVRNWMTERSAIPSATKKLDAKRSQDTVKGGTARTAIRSAPVPQTKSNYVESLRKQRGLE